MFLPLFVQGVIGASATNSGAVLTPMMLGFVVSSAVGGQIVARTGRYKLLAHAGFVLAAIGLFFLSRLSVDATQAEVVRDMVVVGLGVGASLSLFTLIVQNAVPVAQLGQATAGLQFFRSIGGTIGVAVFGSAMNSRFQAGLVDVLPAGLAQVVPPDRLAALQNPQVLLSQEATARLEQSLAALGPQGQHLFEQLVGGMRTSLASAISGLFLVGCGLMLLGLMATLFLPELPLRKRQQRREVAAPEGLLSEPVADTAEARELLAHAPAGPGRREMQK